MSKLISILLILLPVFPLLAQSTIDNEKEALQELLKEREKNFGHYARAAETKSGFFGNQTKKDIRQANQVLVEIIKTDNRIIFLLNNFLDYRNFQQTEMNYSHKDQDEKLNNLNKLADNLTQKTTEMTSDNKQLKKKLIQARIVNYTLGFLCMVIGIMVMRKKIHI
jgi:hypothetical protein